MGFSPFLVLKSRGNELEIKDERGTSCVRGDPFEMLRTILSDNRVDRDADCPVPFTGGGVGFLGYDLGRRIENIPSVAEDDLHLPECCFGFYDAGLVFDHQLGKA